MKIPTTEIKIKEKRKFMIKNNHKVNSVGMIPRLRGLKWKFRNPRNLFKSLDIINE
jgi:hypothetical protein